MRILRIPRSRNYSAQSQDSESRHVAKHVPSVLYLVRFDNFDQTADYRLLLELHTLPLAARSHALLIYIIVR